MGQANERVTTMKHITLAAFAVILLVSSANAQTAAPANPPGGFVSQQPNERLASGSSD